LAVEAALLAKGGAVADFFAYLAATVIGGVALVIAGAALGRRMVAE
jgi:fluoride ion exporter CrcB/FEX